MSARCLYGGEPLSPRETEVTRLMCQGYLRVEIATMLGLSEHTVADHARHAHAKLQTDGRRANLVTEAVARGVVEATPPDDDVIARLLNKAGHEPGAAITPAVLRRYSALLVAGAA